MITDEDVTWRCTNDEGEVIPTLQTAIPGATLMDIRHNKPFRFLCQIEAATALLFKGHYLDEPEIIVERSPRHLRELKDLECIGKIH